MLGFEKLTKHETQRGDQGRLGQVPGGLSEKFGIARHKTTACIRQQAALDLSRQSSNSVTNTAAWYIPVRITTNLVKKGFPDVITYIQ